MSDEVGHATAFGDLEELRAALVGGKDCPEELAQALMYCADHGDTERLLLLLEYGANPNATVSAGGFCRTPLFQALEQRQVAAVRVLLSGGADPNAMDQSGARPLHYAVDKECLDVSNLGQEDSVELTRALLEFDSDPLLSDAAGMSALEEARNRGHQSAVELMEAWLAKQGKAG